MKTRYSLVSNSSSSSFICTTRIEILSPQMWKVISEDHNKTRSKNILQKIKAACKRPDVISGEIGIAIPCCDGPTLIIRSGDRCYVSTRRNYGWHNTNIFDHDLGENSVDIYDKLKDHYFLYVQEDLILRYGSIILSEKSKEKLTCPKCERDDIRYHENGCLVEDYMLSKDGKKYCCYHLCELKENKTKKKS